MVMGKIGSVYDLISREYGVDVATEENSASSVIGVSSLIIAPNNPRRLGLTIVNLSANTLYVRPQGAAAATIGIRLDANGGSVTMNFKDDQHLPSLEWQAVATGGGSQIYVAGVLIR